jgi:hypothetical protein
MVVGGTNLFWTDNGLEVLMKLPISGGTATESGFASGYGIAVDTANLYFVQPRNLSVSKAPLDGNGDFTTITLLAQSGTGPWQMVVDSTNVYWTSRGSGTVSEAPIGGGPVVTLATNQSAPFAIAQDATSIYWNNFGDTAIMRASK